MAKTIRARFDGQVLRPEEPLDLPSDVVYTVTIERETLPTRETRSSKPHPLQVIADMAIEMGVTDLSARHQWYARRDAPGDAE